MVVVVPGQSGIVQIPRAPRPRLSISFSVHRHHTLSVLSVPLRRRRRAYLGLNLCYAERTVPHSLGPTTDTL